MSINKRENPLPMFSERFKELRDRSGMNQVEFAGFLGVSRPTIGFYENGDRIPDARTLATIARKCDVTTDYLVGISDARKAENINVVDKYGFSESALSILEDLYSRQKHNSITLALNALVEDGYVLGAISKYLYYKLETTHYGDVVPYRVVYRYRKDGDIGGWGDAAKKHPIDAGEMLEAVDNNMYKKMLLLEIQEQLLELLKSEEKIDRF